MGTYTIAQIIAKLSRTHPAVDLTRLTSGLAGYGAGPYNQIQIGAVLMEQGTSFNAVDIARTFP